MQSNLCYAKKGGKMAEIEMQDEDEKNESLLSHQRNVTIANYITHKSCQLYFEAYHKKQMPLSFVEFVFNEFKRYEPISIDAVLDFYKIYKPSDLAAIIENYQINFYTLIADVKKKANEVYLKLNKNEYYYVSLSDANMFAEYDPELYKNLDNIAKHIESSDELLSIKELYQAFMIRKIVIASSNPITRNTKSRRISGNDQGPLNKSQKVSEEEINAAKQIGDQTLIGSETDLPNMRGKVVKMYFPRLSLPSPYPIPQQDKSRINSEHRARIFMPTDKQIILVNNKKFNRIKYKTGFIEKRRAAQKSQKKKFDFDF